MTERVVLDSSVLVSAFVKEDTFHQHGREVMRRVFQGRYSAAASVIVPIEVCGVIARRVGVDQAETVKELLVKWETTGLLDCKELTQTRKDTARELAIKLRVRGMDAVIIESAIGDQRSLITFDEDVAEKARKVTNVLTAKDLA